MNSRWQGVFFVPQNSVLQLDPLTARSAVVKTSQPPVLIELDGLETTYPKVILWMYVRSKALLYKPPGLRQMERKNE